MWKPVIVFFSIPGYDIIHNESHLNKADEVLVYIKNNLDYKYEIVY